MKATTKNKKPSSAKPKRIILLDSHAIIHRAYHALPDFSSSKGEPTGALYGLSTMLMRIIADLSPDYIAAAYDLPEKTFRHEAYDAYKAGRAKTDDALVDQLINSRKIFEAFNIPCYDAPGFEADDVLGTIVEMLKDDPSVEIVIASGDMDTLQLVNGKKVQVFTLKKGINDTILYDEAAVLARFGFPPKLLPDYKGLRGDPSDNIIGIKGVGEKTATDLIVSFGTIENMYKVLAKNPEAFLKAGIKERIIELLKEGEEEALFSKTLALIRRDAPIDFVLPQKTFRDSIDIPKIETLFRELEFRSLTARAKALFGQPSDDTNDMEEKAEVAEIDPEELMRLGIALWLLNSEITHVTSEDVVHFEGAQSLEEAREKILAAITAKNLTYVYESIELPIVPVIKSMEERGIKIDTKYFTKLSKDYHAELTSYEKKIWKHAGREFNINSPKQLGEILFDELKLSGGSGVRMKKTEGGARSTRESELAKLSHAHPIVEQILRYRELQKLLSTYIDTIPALADKSEHLHAKFIQAGTTTGRFSSADPNLQNIPIKTELGKNIRNGFVADTGHQLVSFDYSQIELRIAALMSQDEYLLKVFQDGKDVHAAVAAKVFGVPEKEVTHEMRRRAKVINFGILYGMGVSALRENLGTDRKEAQEFYDNYFAEFPSIAGYLDGIKKDALRLGYTETLFGRRRYFPALKSKLPFMRAMAERMAMNAPLQGTAADCIKIAIRDAHEALIKEKLTHKAHLILQVHDELVYEIENSAVEKATKIIESAMQSVIPKEFLDKRKPVPLEVHVAQGKNWGELK